MHVEMKPTPFELASVFCSMDSTEQAEFFNAVAYTVNTTWDRPFCFQLQELTDDKKLQNSGRTIMSAIGEYAQPSEEL